MARRAVALLLLGLLMAGCSQSGVAPPLRAQAQTLEVPESPQYPGIVVRGTLGQEGQDLVVHATARNGGDRTYQVETGCSSPWGEALFRGNDSVPMRRPVAECTSFALAPFAPGDERTYIARWDGRVYEARSGRLVPAPAGGYDWSVRFVAYDPNGTALKRFDLDFPVTVL